MGKQVGRHITPGLVGGVVLSSHGCDRCAGVTTFCQKPLGGIEIAFALEDSSLVNQRLATPVSDADRSGDAYARQE
jgi:hypothetical protein